MRWCIDTQKINIWKCAGAAGAVESLLILPCQTLFHAQTDARVSKSSVSWTQRTGAIAACNMQMRWVLVYSRSVAFSFFSPFYMLLQGDKKVDWPFDRTKKCISTGVWKKETQGYYIILKNKNKLAKIPHFRIRVYRGTKNTNTWYFWAITQDSFFGRSWVIKEIRSAGDSG
jgi:hypothetical protein